jgi:hypothetical protein
MQLAGSVAAHGARAADVHHRCDVMIGCASFDGTDVEELALPLSF